MSFGYGMNQGYVQYAPNSYKEPGWSAVPGHPAYQQYQGHAVVYAQPVVVRAQPGYVNDPYEAQFQARPLFRQVQTAAYEPVMIKSAVSSMSLQAPVIPHGLIPQNFRVPKVHEIYYVPPGQSHRGDMDSHQQAKRQKFGKSSPSSFSSKKPDEIDDDDESTSTNEDGTLRKRERALDPDAIVKGPWTLKEDHKLLELVEEYGLKWSFIARKLKGRIGKQCRERYVNHLNKGIKKSPWTAEEDQVLLDTQEKLGNRWSEISKLLPGRPENSVKNRFNCLIMKKAVSLSEEV
jgi:hypothetical protein